eukprot:3431442-Heterocapsa_arctica.AAC.1
MLDSSGRRPLQGMLVEQGDATVIVAAPTRLPRAAGAEETTSMPMFHSVKISLGTLYSTGCRRVERYSLPAEGARRTTYVYFTEAEDPRCLPLRKRI